MMKEAPKELDALKVLDNEAMEEQKEEHPRSMLEYSPTIHLRHELVVSFRHGVIVLKNGSEEVLEELATLNEQALYEQSLCAWVSPSPLEELQDKLLELLRAGDLTAASG